MIKVIQYSSKFKKQTISLVKKVLEKEFHLKVNQKKRPDIYDIEKYYFNKKGNFWIALDDDKVIGTVALLYYGRKRACLKIMYLDKGYRGEGVSKKLLLKLLSFAKSNNYKVIYAPTIKKMIAANKFYQKNGFKKTSYFPKDFRLEEDKVFYKLEL